MAEKIMLAYLVVRKKVDRYSEVRRFNNLRTSCLSIGCFLKVSLWEPRFYAGFGDIEMLNNTP